MGKFMINNACCKDDPGNGDPENDCLDKWKKEHEKACNDYKKAAAQTEKFREEYINSLNWETKLENWDRLITEADKKSKDIVTQLDFLLEQVKIVCEKSKCTTEALEKLTCLVKTIFDCFFTFDENKEGLKDKITAFKKAVECLQNVSDEDKAEVIKCIEAYEEKIVLVCEMQDAILEKLLETLKCAHLLYAAICKEDGLEDKLKGIREDFNGDGSEDDEHCDDDEDQGENEEEQNENDPDKYKYPCDDKKAKPIPTFPISSSWYYKKVRKDYETATEKTESLKEDWINSKKESDTILSKKTSLAEAIKAAEAAESGK
ncbi:hypothetical protein GWK08_01245 [Leptobacterium flavescens]|uniref:Uncharacterized protein n=1 Tax=Leptobacterium flavescens TaxID=472055 RepID=A0A6P0ULW6_9FLAO|nr:hypothetical protein [Leptobacterium flavescens]NER12053.1 hypothetical protein [Leptobacterium flavescens]